MRPSPALLAAALLCMAAAAPEAALAQSPPNVPAPTRQVNLSGPRFGVTYLAGAITDSLAAHDLDVAPVITQFGWQWERIFYGVAGGPVVVSEWVLLVGGLDQQVFLPSLSWLIGIRTNRGAEFGVGPHVGPSGVALAIAGGVTKQLGTMNIPLNVALVPTRIGPRVSFLAGISMR